MWKGGQWLYQVEVSRRRAFVFQVLELISKRQLSRKAREAAALSSCPKEDTRERTHEANSVSKILLNTPV